MWFAVAMAVVSLAMSAYAMMNMPKFNQDDSGVELADAGAAQEINFVYGRSRVQCNKVFEDVARQGQSEVSEGDWLSVVAVAGQGPFHALKQIYVNGTPVLKDSWKQFNAASCGVIGKEHIEDRFSGHVQIQFNMGEKDYFYSMINQMHPKWDKTCVGKGIASVALKILRDPYKGEIQASPQIEVEVEGRLVRDIRMTSSVPVYSSTMGTPGTNPALCILDYLVHPNGVGISWDDIDEYSFAQLAGYFDKFNYRCNGVVNQGQSIKANLEALQADFQCVITKPMNKWTLISWTPDVVDVEFTEDDILEKDVEISWGSSKLNFNRLEVEYQDASKEFQKDILSYPACTNDELIAKDGNVTVKKIEAKFTTSKEQVDRFASVYYESNRSLCVLKFKGNEKAYNSQVGDIVQVTHGKFQLNKKLFKVAAIKRSTTVEETATAEITLAEYTPTAFDTTHTSNTGDAVVMPPEVVDKPHNLRFTVAEVGDTFTGCLRWDRAYCYDFLEYVVEYKLSSQPESEWQHYGRTQNNEMYLFNLHGAYYDFRVFTRTRFMKTSDFEYLYKVDVVDDTVLPKVTGLKLVTTNKDKGITDTRNFEIVWDSMDDVAVKPDLQMLPNATGYQTVATVKKGYEVEISHGTVYRRTVYTTEPKFIYTFDMNVLDGTSRYVNFKVRILSKGGSKSREPAVLEAKNRQCQQPNVVDTKGEPGGVQIRWDKCLEEDYQATKVYLNRTKGFTPSDADIPKNAIITDTHMFYSNLSGIWYCRVAHYDVLGQDELQFSPEYPLNAFSVEDMMTKLDSENNKLIMESMKGVETKLDADIKKASADASTALKTSTDALNAELKKSNAEIASVKQTVNTNQQKAAQDINALRVEMTTADAALQAGITATNKAYADADKALAESVTKLRSDTTTLVADTKKELNATITKTEQTLTAKDEAISKSVNDVSVKLNGVDATVKTQATAIADINGNLSGQYSVSVSANDVFGGFTLYGDTKTKTSKFIISVDDFMVVNPKTSTKTPVFEIKDGKTLILNALINDLGASNIRAGSITVDRLEANYADITIAKISDGTITFAKIEDVIQSSNYVKGQSGWMLNKSGYLEASNANIRGNITASDISGSIIRGSMLITDSNSEVLLPTDADGRGGCTYVCQGTADASMSLGRVNASYYWTPWTDMATYEYTAEGYTTSSGGTKVMSNTRRFKHANNHMWWNSSVVIAPRVFNSVYLEWILHNGQSQQLAAQSGRINCASQKWSHRGTDTSPTPGYIAPLQGNINGINYRLTFAWELKESHTEGMDMYRPVVYREYYSYVSKVEIWGEFDVSYTGGASRAMRARVQVTPDCMQPSEGGGICTIERFSMYTQQANLK
ncbi:MULTISPECIES: phage tail tip fiber protein [Aeromonas]|uniref:phage tail tip fiber protein n=1 Tax=Aeromonas TaxID=642 RepID=UPI00030B29CE|nr:MULTISPECIES: DUF1983 domain-containing protein [Aeromonas]MBW3732450.1 DUF1983 domain-containing protein [Aeromonas dhakensis]QSR57013.1 DUF1983 domain-containing protein [Aeromonas dhakensis]